MTHPESIKPNPDAYDVAYEACRKAREQLDQKIEQWQHSGGPCPTEADYELWTDAVTVLEKAGEELLAETLGSHAK
jgi:hypothetical protein